MSRPTFVDALDRKEVVITTGGHPRVGRLWHASDNGTVAVVEIGGELEKVPVEDVEVVDA